MAIIGIQAIDLSAAYAEEGKNDLPWAKEDGDMPWFSFVTKDGILVVGGNTFDSMPPLKNREIWKMSSKGELNSAEKVLEKYTAEGNGRDLFICGGAGVWESFRPHYDIFYMTIINGTFVDPEKKKTWLASDNQFDWQTFLVRPKYSVAAIYKAQIKLK